MPIMFEIPHRSFAVVRLFTASRIYYSIVERAERIVRELDASAKRKTYWVGVGTFGRKFYYPTPGASCSLRSLFLFCE